MFIFPTRTIFLCDLKFYSLCLSPTKIKNPNFGRTDKLAYLVDTKSFYLNVPCGHCSECVYMRQSSIVQRCIAEELDNHLFFCTLTYNDESMPVVHTSTGFDIRYADFRDFVLMMKRFRKADYLSGRTIRYFTVSELGTKRGRPHLHSILFVQKFSSDDFNTCMQLESLLFDKILFEWRRNYGSTRKPIYKPLCTYVRKFIRGQLKSNYDLHYMNPTSTDKGNSDVAFYVSKYMIKPSDRAERLQQALKLNLVVVDPVTGESDSSEYEDIWKVVKPRFIASTNFGLNSDVQRSYVRECIDISKRSELNPKFYNRDCGFSYPLSRYYYRKNVYTLSDANHFLSKRSDLSDPIYIDDRASDVKIRKLDKLALIQDQVEKNDMSFDFDNF